MVLCKRYRQVWEKTVKTQEYVSTYKNMKDMKVHKEHSPLPRHWSYQAIHTVKTWTGFKFRVSALSIDTSPHSVTLVIGFDWSFLKMI